MPNILFVCTANRCRSPMAEALLQHILSTQSAQDWCITSAGTWAVDGLPAMPNTIAVMREWGLDLQSHSARSVDEEILACQDLILVMEAGHREALTVEFPGHAERIRLLAAMAGPPFDIKDPVRGTMADYQATAQLLHGLLSQGLPTIERLAGGTTATEA